MSLLDGRDQITLFPLLEGRDEFGMPIHQYLAPLTVRCTPQWQTPNQNPALGLDPHTRVVVLARRWAGMPQCRFWWRGMTFEQVGEAKWLYGSPRTAHYEVQANLIASVEVDPRDSDSEEEAEDEGEGG